VRSWWRSKSESATSNPREGSATDSAPEAWRGEGTVLVVEDEDLLRDLTADSVERLGFSTLTAADGERAIEVFRQHRDAIVGVVSDYRMPRKNGAEVFEELREIDPEIRVILCSGVMEEDLRRNLLARGLAAFLQKPYRAETLQKLLREALAR